MTVPSRTSTSGRPLDFGSPRSKLCLSVSRVNDNFRGGDPHCGEIQDPGAGYSWRSVPAKRVPSPEWAKSIIGAKSIALISSYLTNTISEFSSTISQPLVSPRQIFLSSKCLIYKYPLSAAKCETEASSRIGQISLHILTGYPVNIGSHILTKKLRNEAEFG
ncbi:hypothetical protein V9T40_010613 [Parthenolecanium corni]|uniref:Uncharacterized protein n=1 Tax=Parthenolecanium corni TaxID=536013 RepID=A0AAN9T3V3_9HEMI